jgi:hypothetical protein
MTLYEMSDTARQLYALLDAGEIDEQTVLDTMESIGAAEKLESYVFIQKQLEAEIAAFKAEIERMTERKRSLEANVERMKRAQIDYMQATGQRSASAGTFKLTLRDNKSVAVDDESLIPREFMVEKPATYQPDKKAIMAALKDGKTVAGAHIETSTTVTAR